MSSCCKACEEKQALADCSVYEQLFRSSILSKVIWKIDVLDWAKSTMVDANDKACSLHNEQWGEDLSAKIGQQAGEAWISLKDDLIPMLQECVVTGEGKSFEFNWSPDNRAPKVYRIHISKIDKDLVLVAYTDSPLEIRRQEDLDWFAGAASHDLLSPLRGAMGAMGRFRSHRDKGNIAKSEQWLGRVDESLERMELRVQSFLDYVRAPGGDGNSFRLRLALADALKHHDDDLAQCVSSTLGDEMVIGNRSAVAIVFHQLLVNASKYRHPDRELKISISLEPREDNFIVAVADNGLGIPADRLADVFKPRVRLHGKNIEGSGLGLATCRRILERHDTHIVAHSDGSSGTTINFELKRNLGESCDD